MRKRLIVLLAAVSSTCSATPASAPEWELTYAVKEGKLHIDASSVYSQTRKQQFGDRKVRTMLTYPSMQTDADGVQYRSVESIDLVSCKNYTKTAMSRLLYEAADGKGRVVGRRQMRGALPIAIRPGSTDELILGEANCDYRTGKWASEEDWDLIQTKSSPSKR